MNIKMFFTHTQKKRLFEERFTERFFGEPKMVLFWKKPFFGTHIFKRI